MLYQLSYIHRSRRGLYSAPVKMQPLSLSKLMPMFALWLASGCAHHPTGSSGAPRSPATASVVDEITRTRKFVLQHDVAFGPVVRLEQQTQTRDGIEVSARPVRLEAEPWNSWPDGTARLFNDAVAFGIEVDIRGADVRWDAAHTQLAVNTTDQVFPPAPSAAETLLHLLWLARDEARAGLAPDSELRLKSSDAYRAAYLSTTPGAEAAGLIVFPAPAAQLFAVALQLTLGIEVGDREEQFTFLFE